MNWTRQINCFGRFLSVWAFGWLTAGSTLIDAAAFYPLQFGVNTNIHQNLIAISEDGQVIAARTTDGPLVRWTQQNGSRILLFETSNSVSISGDGATIVASRPRPQWRSFDAVSFNDGFAEVLPTLAGDDSGEAVVISQDGQSIFGYSVSVGSSFSDDVVRGVKWSDGAMTESAFGKWLRAVSAHGEVAVGNDADGRPYRWTEADGMQSLPPTSLRPNDWPAVVFGLSSDGEWAVGRASDPDGPQQHLGLRWNGTAAPEPLMPKESHWGTAGTDATPDGSLVVGRIYLGDGEIAAGIWTETTGLMEPLQDLLISTHGLGDALEGWNLTGIYDVTDDGRFMVGSATNPTGNDEAFLVDLGAPILGDFNRDGVLDAVDIDDLSAAVRAGNHPPQFDLDGNDLVNLEDRVVWIHDLKSTYYGDANLDGEFNSGDLVSVFEAGQYEDQVPGNSSWQTGDWNGDTEFGSADLVSAFQDGGYEQGPRQSVAAVPEPSTALLLAMAAMAIVPRADRRRP